MSDTDNIRGDVPIPSLGEDSTTPIEDDQTYPMPVTRSRIEHELALFISEQRGSTLSRGLPYVHRIVFDRGLGMPHVWFHLKVPIRGASEATKVVIKNELEALADQVATCFMRGFALSVVLD